MKAAVNTAVSGVSQATQLSGTSTSGHSFLNTLEKAKHAQDNQRVGLSKLWQNFHKDWVKAGAGTERLVKRLPAQAKDMLQLQVTVNQLHLRSMMATKAAESVSNTVRRMQQMGSS